MFSRWIQFLREQLFPPKVTLRSKTLEILQGLMPDFPWEQTIVYRITPWFVGRGVNGIVLPLSYGRGKYAIWVSKEIDPNTVYGIQLLCHESIHCLQYQRLGGWFGFLFFRRFLWHYVSLFLWGVLKNLRHGIRDIGYRCYRYHPMEVPAYEFEESVRQYLLKQVPPNKFLKPTEQVSLAPPANGIALPDYHNSTSWAVLLLGFPVMVGVLPLKLMVDAIFLVLFALVFWMGNPQKEDIP